MGKIKFRIQNNVKIIQLFLPTLLYEIQLYLNFGFRYF